MNARGTALDDDAAVGGRVQGVCAIKKKAKRKPRGLTQDPLKKVDPYVYAVWRSENPKGKQMTKEDFVRISSELHRQNWPEDYRD